MKKLLWILLGAVVLFSRCQFSSSKVSSTASTERDFQEKENPISPSVLEWDKQQNNIAVSWTDPYIRHKKECPATADGKTFNSLKELEVKAWKGEHLNLSAVVSSKIDIKSLKWEISDVKKDGEEVITKESFSGGFIRYVMTDELNKDGKGGCGVRSNPSEFDSSLSADIIDHHKDNISIDKNSTRTLWIGVDIGRDLTDGVYKGLLTLNIDGEKEILSLSIEVLKREMPKEADKRFHLDLWQNPFAIARYYKVELWSKEHFEIMKPYMVKLAKAGQKTITTSIMHRPWNGQTEDPYESMIDWVLEEDGRWSFDYTIFDNWVEFMTNEVGITGSISCFTMIPWQLSFRYLDKKSGKFVTVETKPGEKVYDEMWSAMLTSFATHLKDKKWFERAVISMDERPMDLMQKVIAIIKKADAGFKISLAGVYHKEIEKDLWDYSIALNEEFPLDVLKQRASEGKVSTYYTCCTEPYPNMFTFSPVAESSYTAIYAAKIGVNGYLRWAYNHWVKNPLTDSRFRTWAAGDTYLIYPGVRSSVRLESFIDGIESYEKIMLLKKEWKQDKNSAKLMELEEKLSSMNPKGLLEKPAIVVVNDINNWLNQQ